MPLSRSAALRFALERTAAGLAGNWLAIVTIAGLGLLLVWGGYRLVGEPGRIETAEVMGFGGYETEVGTKPIVRVRTAQGVVQELIASAPALSECRRGRRIWLIRRAHGLIVDPRGCRAA
ncbi:MAG TPA: hypothetical protein VFW19_18710 [Allosphingosinicella sp.]|nr:hypothetical protein [Allosphingosinicella sp.]